MSTPAKERPFPFPGSTKRALMVAGTEAARDIRAANRNYEDQLADLLRRLALAGNDDIDLAAVRLEVASLYDAVEQTSSACRKLADAIYARCTDAPSAPAAAKPVSRRHKKWVRS